MQTRYTYPDYRKGCGLAAVAIFCAGASVATPTARAESQKSVEVRICQDEHLSFLCRSGKGQATFQPDWLRILKLMRYIGIVEADSGTIDIAGSRISHRHLEVPEAVANSPDDDGKPNATTGEVLTGIRIELNKSANPPHPWEVYQNSTKHRCGDLDDESPPNEWTVDQVNNRFTCGRYTGHPGINPGEDVDTLKTELKRPQGNIAICVTDVWFEYTATNGYSHWEQAHRDQMPTYTKSNGQEAVYKYWPGYRSSCPATLLPN